MAITILFPLHTNQEALHSAHLPTVLYYDSHTELIPKQIAHLMGMKQDSLRMFEPVCGRYYPPCVMTAGLIPPTLAKTVGICEMGNEHSIGPQIPLKHTSVKGAQSLAFWQYRTFLVGVWLWAVPQQREIITPKDFF